MAAKLPAPATTFSALAGTGRRLSRTTQMASPPPMAISGASGPSTTPSASVARAARITPGSSDGLGAPPAWNPSAGECPPRPGRYLIAAATSTPATASSGTGHHTGSPWKPSPWGRLVNSQCWSWLTRYRKK